MNRRLLSRLTKALLNTLKASLIPRNRSVRHRNFSGTLEMSVLTRDWMLNPLHPVLSHRRYSPCISDLKCVLNVAGMSRQFSTVCLDTWIDILAISQGMDKQIWRPANEGHVESEPRGWVGAFNCSISLGSLFERILSWEGAFSVVHIR